MRDSHRRSESRTKKSFQKDMAGDEGFEPPNGGTRTHCLTTWRIPNVHIHYSIHFKKIPPNPSQNTHCIFKFLCYNSKTIGTLIYIVNLEKVGLVLKQNIFKKIFYKILRRKYEIVSFPVYAFGADNVRIRALRDIPRHNVRKYDIGGSVEGYHNLSQFGDCWIGENGKVLGKARVSGDAIVRSQAKIYGHAKIKGQAIVYGWAKVCGHAVVKDMAEIYCQATVSEHAEVKGKSFIHGSVSLSGNCIVSGRTVVRDTAQICDMAIVHDSDVSGNTIIRNDARVLNQKIRNVTIFSSTRFS